MDYSEARINLWSGNCHCYTEIWPKVYMTYAWFFSDFEKSSVWHIFAHWLVKLFAISICLISIRSYWHRLPRGSNRFSVRSLKNARPPGDGEINEMTVPSRHIIRDSSPGGLRSSTLPLNVESLRVSGEETFCFFETWMPERGSKPRSSTFQADSFNNCLEMSLSPRAFGTTDLTIFFFFCYTTRTHHVHVCMTYVCMSVCMGWLCNPPCQWIYFIFCTSLGLDPEDNWFLLSNLTVSPWFKANTSLVPFFLDSFFIP